MRSALIIVLVLAVIGVVAFIFLNLTQGSTRTGESTSPVLVDILLPRGGASVSLGETLPVLAQAWSPSPLVDVQLWVDGQLSETSNAENSAQPYKVSWDWEAASLGVHTLYVQAHDEEGEEGQSQTLIFNVSAGGVNQISAAGGESLADIGGGLGIPVSDLEGANPNIDPEQPLGDGQPVILPPNEGGADSSQGEEAASGPNLVIHWQFIPLDDVDQSYCYQSLGGGFWQKVPADPFVFLPGDEWLQTIFPENQQTLDLQLECWGWQGGILKYLGEGQTSVDYTQVPDELIIAAAGFQAIGSPEMKPLGGGGIPDEDLQVPAPFALREPETVAECASHYGGNIFAGTVCDGLMNSQIKQYYILEWEWQPTFCWPGTDCAWVDHVDGFWIYELDPSLQSGNWIKDIPVSDQKVTAVPLPWGAKCYGVVAYANLLTSEGVQAKGSQYAIYCPGDPPEPKKLILSTEDWLSTDGEWIKEDCEDYGDAPYFSPSGTQLSVGVYQIDKDDCFRQGDSSAAVKFQMPLLGQGAVIQHATLLFSPVDLYYVVDSEVATNLDPFCASRLGKAKQDWSALSDAHFTHGGDTLASQDYFAAYKSGFSYQPGGQLGTDVTSAVLGWVDNPGSNHGFIFSYDWAALLNAYVFESDWDQSVCYSLLDNVQLEIQYYEPGI